MNAEALRAVERLKAVAEENHQWAREGEWPPGCEGFGATELSFRWRDELRATIPTIEAALFAPKPTPAEPGTDEAMRVAILQGEFRKTPAEPMERFTKEEREALTFAGTCIERVFGEEPYGKAGEYHRILRALTPEPGEETP